SLFKHHRKKLALGGSLRPRLRSPRTPDMCLAHPALPLGPRQTELAAFRRLHVGHITRDNSGGRRRPASRMAWRTAGICWADDCNAEPIPLLVSRAARLSLRDRS